MKQARKLDDLKSFIYDFIQAINCTATARKKWTPPNNSFAIQSIEVLGITC
jgi:hypothetical protein